MGTSTYNSGAQFGVAIQSQVDFLRQSQQLAVDGPFYVQTGQPNQLLSYDTTGLKPGSIAVVNDLGGSGNGGAPGVGLVFWSGVGWRRLVRGAQVTMAPAATISLDYFKDPLRVVLSGTTVSPTRFLISNAPNTALYCITKPGIAAALAAFGVNLAGGTPATDIAVVGPTIGFFEVVSGALSQVQTY